MLRTLIASLALAIVASSAGAQVRIKDVVSFEGVRENHLIGYGLVVGLDGTGDSLRNSAFTKESIEGMLGRLGVGNLSDEDIQTKNAAAVMVTASLPPFARRGSRIDLVVSSLGDAGSLRGGTLLVTPLSGADGEIYAVGQGPVSVGGFAAMGNAASVVEGVKTVARVENGATVEREIDFSLEEMETLRLALRNPDATTASRIAEAINNAGKSGRAKMLDPGTVEVQLAKTMGVAQTIAAIEQIAVSPDTPAKVVIDAKSGTIIIGSNVRIDEVAISQGGLTVSVKESAQVVQPEPVTIGTTVVVPATEISIEKKDSGFAVVGGQVSLQELVDGLNAIGIGAQETISILQAIKAAGALHADMEII